MYVGDDGGVDPFGAQSLSYRLYVGNILKSGDGESDHFRSRLGEPRALFYTGLFIIGVRVAHRLYDYGMSLAEFYPRITYLYHRLFLLLVV